MEYKSIEELYLAVGVAGAIIIVFLGVFVYTIVQNDKKRSREMAEIIQELRNLQLNDTKFQSAMENLSEAVKELSATNKIVADTVGKLDYFNRDINRKLEKHDDKADKILDELRK